MHDQRLKNGAGEIRKKLTPCLVFQTLQKLDKLAHLALSRFKYSNFCSPKIRSIRKEKGNVENGQRKNTYLSENKD